MSNPKIPPIHGPYPKCGKCGSDMVPVQIYEDGEIVWRCTGCGKIVRRL